MSSQMALSPVYKMNDTGDGLTKVRAQRKAHPAVTKYRVLDSSSGCSLVELQPLTGKLTEVPVNPFLRLNTQQPLPLTVCFQSAGAKHQMRVHMAFALSCPILGDHKYSHWSKLAPQVKYSVCVCV